MVNALEGNARWAFRDGDPLQFPINSIPGWALISPAVYPRIIDSGALGEALVAKPSFIVDDFYHFNTNFLLTIPLDESDADLQTGEAATEWERAISAFTNHLRFSSKQSSLKPIFQSFGPTSLELLPPPYYCEPGGDCATPSWALNTAIKSSHIIEAGKQSIDSSPPSYGSFLLDAINASIHGDYTTAFTHACISIEHLSRFKVGDALRNCLEKTNASDLKIEFSPDVPDEQKIDRSQKLSDLILKNRKVKQLLYEVAQVVLGRSLQIEDKALYDRVLKIFERRNKVFHESIDFSEKGFQRFAGMKEAVEAIRCAVELVQWFSPEVEFPAPWIDGPAICRLPKLDKTK